MRAATPTCISPPMPGSSHDQRIADTLRITTVLPGDSVTADLGYEGTGFDIPQKRKHGQKVLEPWQQRFNNALASIRWVTRTSNRPHQKLENTSQRLPITHSHHEAHKTNPHQTILLQKPPNNLHSRKSSNWSAVGFKARTECSQPVAGIQHISDLR
ncbi:transposase family protein [Corynebacterium canis]|uniref:transposase family protein n=1 Tax=Corynebacterium canis TaxID=679663 RepID=UPI00338D95F2